MKRSPFFIKTMVLTISNVITGTITFVFSIILSRKLGPGGIGLYQLVMPLYTMFLCITGGGVTVSISKIAAEMQAKGNLKELYKTIKATIYFEIIWSIIITIILILSSYYISNNVLNDKRTLYSIFAFCPAIIIVSVSSVYKGAFYGLQKVIQPAIIDIFEKLVRLFILFVFFNSFTLLQIKFSTALAVLSLSFGELSSLILFYISFKGYVRKNPGRGKSDNSIQLVTNVLKLAIPLAINGILSTIFATVITVLIPKRLQYAGIKYEDALAMFGKLQGMALTIIFYPALIISSLNTLLIPSISEAVTYKKDNIINHKINTALRVTSITAFSSTAIILSIPTEIGLFFFNDKSIGDLLIILAPSIPLLYFEITTFAILNGLGKQKNILINSTIISLFDLIALYIFLGISAINIKGFAINFIISALIGIVINMMIIKKACRFRFDLFNTITLPLLCSVFSYIVTKALLMRTHNAPTIIALSYLIFSLPYFILYTFSKTRKTKDSV